MYLPKFLTLLTLLLDSSWQVKFVVERVSSLGDLDVREGPSRSAGRITLEYNRQRCTTDFGWDRTQWLGPPIPLCFTSVGCFCIVTPDDAVYGCQTPDGLQLWRPRHPEQCRLYSTSSTVSVFVDHNLFDLSGGQVVAFGPDDTNRGRILSTIESCRRAFSVL